MFSMATPASSRSEVAKTVAVAISPNRTSPAPWASSCALLSAAVLDIASRARPELLSRRGELGVQAVALHGLGGRGRIVGSIDERHPLAGDVGVWSEQLGQGVGEHVTGRSLGHEPAGRNTRVVAVVVPALLCRYRSGIAPPNSARRRGADLDGAVGGGVIGDATARGQARHCSWGVPPLPPLPRACG